MRFLSLLLLCLRMSGAVCTSTTSGLWSNPSTWSCGNVPTCGDSVVIQAGMTVTVSAQIDYSSCSSAMAIDIKGQLYFINGKKMTLPCNSRVYIRSGGLIDSDGAGSSNRLEMCNVTHWMGGVGPLYGPMCIPSTLTNCATVLPIELLSFEAASFGEGVKLRWSTATERESKEFDVERSDDAMSWELVTRVASKAENGLSTQMLSYETSDLKPTIGVIYYRLVQRDFDGTTSNSRIIVHNFNREDLMVFPNPSNGAISATINCTLIVLTSGSQQVFHLIAGTPLDINLPSGFYVCELTSDKGSQPLKLVVLE